VTRGSERAQPLIQAVRIAPRELRARADAEHREVAEGGLADIREGGERFGAPRHRRTILPA